MIYLTYTPVPKDAHGNIISSQSMQQSHTQKTLFNDTTEVSDQNLFAQPNAAITTTYPNMITMNTQGPQTSHAGQ